MRSQVLAVAILLAGAGALYPQQAQQLGPNAPNSIQTANLPGVELRFLDFRWDPALFAAFETGSGELPAAKRSWAIGRIVLHDRSLMLGKVKLRQGTTQLVILHPNLDKRGMSIELRRIDMRDEIFNDRNVVALPPPGETLYKAPARFETISETRERMTLTLAESAGNVQLGTHYGNRRLVLDFATVAR